MKLRTAFLAATMAAMSIGQAAAEEPLRVNIPANSLGVHVPYMAALNEIFPELGHPKPVIERVKQLSTITQSVLGGQTDLAAGDAISTLRAVEAGANLAIIGNAFMNTSLVFVVNGDKIETLKDLEKDDVTVAVNSKGDFTHVMLIGPMKDAGVDVDSVEVIKMGGSGNRMRALIAGKVDGVPLHFDQAEQLAEQGNFKVLIRPAEFYDAFLGEVWIVSDEWLSDPANKAIAKDVLKATAMAFRRTQDDFAWYADMYRKYGTNEKMANASDDEIRMTYDYLVENGVFPRDLNHDRAVYETLLPVYVDAGAVRGTVELDDVVDTQLSDAAVAELDGA